MSLKKTDIEKLNAFLKGQLQDDDGNFISEIFCDQDKENGLIHFMKENWYEILKYPNLPEKDLNHILYKLNYEINSDKLRSKSKFSKIFRYFEKAAAIIAIPLLIYFGISVLSNDTLTKNLSIIEIKAPNWTRIQFNLPDGTKGWLNSNSSLIYKTNFIENREISLNGEAYFNVSKNEKKPFIVKSGNVNIKVLGTKFNVSSYEDENNIQVALEEGRLLFSDKEKNQSNYIIPNELLNYSKINKRISVEKVEPLKYTSWTEGKLTFRNDPIDVVAKRLGRWYNVEVEVISKSDRDPRLRATFLDDSLEEILAILKSSLGISYTIKNHELSSDGSYSKKKVIITINP